MTRAQWMLMVHKQHQQGVPLWLAIANLEPPKEDAAPWHSPWLHGPLAATQPWQLQAEKLEGEGGSETAHIPLLEDPITFLATMVTPLGMEDISQELVRRAMLSAPGVAAQAVHSVLDPYSTPFSGIDPSQMGGPQE